MQSDAELVEAVLGGHREAYGVLVKRYERAACATARVILVDYHAAQDAAQEAFVKGYQKLRKLRKASAFGPWVLKIVWRQAMSMARRRRNIVPLDSQPEPVAADSNHRLDEISRELLEAVMRLPAHERLSVMLKYFDGHGLQSIADMTGRSIGTVSKQLTRARGRLRIWLREVEP